MDTLFNLPGTVVVSAEQFVKRKKIPRYRCFSLSDFKEFDRCRFSFLVKHHLGKKYELEEATSNQALGSLLDLTIKKIHQNKVYKQPLEFLINIVKASEEEMRDHVLRNGETSFYGGQVKFLTPELIQKAKEIFSKYYQSLGGKIKKNISPKTFWEGEYLTIGGEDFKLWGGADSVEMGEDGVPEVVDYKYFEDNEKGKYYLDMDLMPKLYILLAALDLKNQGFNKARFKIRLWQDGADESLMRDFDLSDLSALEILFQDKVSEILMVEEASCCDKDYCKACKSPHREEWLKQIQGKVWLKD